MRRAAAARRSAWAALGLAAHHLAPGDLGARAQTHPTGKVADLREAGHVRAGFADHRQGRGDLDAVDASQVHAADLEQVAAQVELGRVAGPAPLTFAGLAILGFEDLHLLFEFLVDFGQLGSEEVEGVQGLFEGEQVLGPPVALQAFGYFLRAGLNAAVPAPDPARPTD